MEIHIHIHHHHDYDEATLTHLTHILKQGETIMAKIDDLKTQIKQIKDGQAEIATNVEEIDGDVKEIKQKLDDAGTNGIDAAGVTELQTMLGELSDSTGTLKDKTRAVADIVPES